MSIKNFKTMSIFQFEEGTNEYNKQNWLKSNIINVWIYSIILLSIVFVLTVTIYIIFNINFIFLTHLVGMIVGAITIIVGITEKKNNYHYSNYFFGFLIVLFNLIAIIIILVN